MNDFTKEELKDLWAYIREFMGNGYEHPTDHKGYILMRKLQSMIDNYCEHHDRVSSSDDNGHLVVQCGRCDLVLWHEKD